MSIEEKKRELLSTEQILARLRAHLHTAHVDSGKSLSQLTAELGLGKPSETSEYLSGRRAMTVEQLIRFARATGKPIWWFFGEQPATITVEAAETGLQNVSRIKLYLEAVEAEFRNVVGPEATPSRELLKDNKVVELHQPKEVVVDFEPYLKRAREILSREASKEDNGEVSEESIEMVAQGLYSAEMGCLPPNSFESVER